ncbi:uncharacterized protein PFL1_01233 [Pseudozyma flocculosa PF-1]|uniref:Membrane anchor Opy2 N-terminal domain-containing protein n=1 Tax=Pseudozyma flocculosa TaxID=84751 RepID=A0A5C3EXI8_9BASI|nr:uncharacterized protein PFL1_01233 [Pseudozyma flocculosa PF-1]EPQ31044.1 hypothetical protein PFL1_01233 [Pseudozyma flocculosa PF-1]SPO35889.1 uncharacterized protein PSFLO_01360 [Pseudozyma flocculosa]
MLEHSHLPLRLVRQKRDDGSGCAVCASIEPCPPCKKGYQCQQIFRSSCQTCPVNKCVPIDGEGSGSSGSSSSSLGGALGGVLGALAIALVAFLLWRRSRRKRIALENDARRRSELAAQEKRGLEKGGVTIQLGGGGANGGANGAHQPDLLDNDTEWTQIEGNPLESLDTLDPLQEPTVFKRRSFGAATHLSKITEGAEEEEEDEDDDDAARNGDDDGQRGGPGTGRASTSGRSSRHGRQSSKSSSVQVGGAGPRISVGSGTTFSSGNIIPITFRPSPASPASSMGVPISPGPQSSESGTPPSVPAPAHRAVGAPIVEVTGSQQPLRPVRSPHLNLRLADGAEPGQKPNAGGAGPSSMLSPYAVPGPGAAANGRKLSFMNIDPASALQQSRVYLRADNRLSTATVNTMASVSTAGLDYVLSAPQIITPVTADGARRVQLNKGGKAQLVRGGSLKRKDGESGDSSPTTTPSAVEHGDPFSDAAAAAGATVTTSPIHDGTLKPRYAQSVGRSHMSTSTLGIPFADETFMLQDPTNSSPIDADRSSWLGARTSFATSIGRDGREDGGSNGGDDGDDGDDDRRSPFSDEAAAIPLPDSMRSTPIERMSTASGAPAGTRGASTVFDASRSSRTDSIGGLSVFDQFPIAIGTEPLPANAQSKLMSIAERDDARGRGDGAGQRGVQPEVGEEADEEAEEELVVPRQA